MKALLVAALVLGLLPAVTSAAGSKKAGEICTVSSECVAGTYCIDSKLGFVCRVPGDFLQAAASVLPESKAYRLKVLKRDGRPQMCCIGDCGCSQADNCCPSTKCNKTRNACE